MVQSFGLRETYMAEVILVPTTFLRVYTIYKVQMRNTNNFFLLLQPMRLVDLCYSLSSPAISMASLLPSCPVVR